MVSNPGQVVKPRTTQHYETKGGSCPFEKWFDSLTIKGQTKVAARLTSVRSGNLGVTKGVGEGVKEMKFNPKGHPTYRIYYGEDGDTLVILLCGGDKSDQSRDINKAKEYWDDYKSRK